MKQKKTKTESIKNLNANGIHYDRFKEICLKLGNGFKRYGQYSNLMEVDEWVNHYNKYSPNLEITKEEIILVFEHLINFHEDPKIIMKIAGAKNTYASNNNIIIIPEIIFADEILVYEVLN